MTTQTQQTPAIRRYIASEALERVTRFGTLAAVQAAVEKFIRDCDGDGYSIAPAVSVMTALDGSPFTYNDRTGRVAPYRGNRW